MRGKRCHWLTVGAGPGTCKDGPVVMVPSYFSYLFLVDPVTTWKGKLATKEEQ